MTIVVPPAPLNPDQPIIDQWIKRKGLSSEQVAAGFTVDAAELFGPNHAAVVDVIRTIQTATPEQVKRLDAAWDAARDAARDAAWDAAWGAARDAAWDAAWGAARDAAWDAAWGAAWGVAWDAAWGAVVWDLADPDGPFTPEHRDLLIAPWESVFGLPEGLTRKDQS